MGWCLGILAGGEGQRLGGFDKAWLSVHGQAQWRRLVTAFGTDASEILIARGAWPAIPDLPRSARCVPDRPAVASGPLAGIDALADACRERLVMTLPVDLHPWPIGLQASLLDAVRGGPGAVLVDATGLQPLLAAWSTEVLRRTLLQSRADGDSSVRGLVERAGLTRLERPDWVVGNINRPEDLRAVSDRPPAP